MEATRRPTPVVFLHSAGLTPRMWQDQVEAVALREAQGTSAAQGTRRDQGTSRDQGAGDAQGAGELQVLAPWLVGLRPGRPAELSLPNAAAGVVSQLDANGIGRAYLVGHQLGAMAALQVAVTQPGRVAGLVLSGALVSPGKLAMGMQKGLIRMLPNRAFAESGATTEDLIRALDAIAAADFGKRLAEIRMPVLLVSGAADPSLPSAKLLAQRLPNARLVEIPGAGANPNLEQPAAYNKLLTDFLS